MDRDEILYITPEYKISTGKKKEEEGDKPQVVRPPA